MLTRTLLFSLAISLPAGTALAGDTGTTGTSGTTGAAGAAGAADKATTKPAKPTKAAKGAPAIATTIPPDAGPPLDLGDVRDKLTLLTDGKGHYLATIPFGPTTEHVYYGDGKVFWAQRIFAGGINGTESFTRSFWEPRSLTPNASLFWFREGKYHVDCQERTAEVTPVPEEEQKAKLAEAVFYGPRWKRKAYALLRDNRGRYFYIDNMREPADSKAFRFFVGMKGSLKVQHMLNVVSDSEGDIFATRSGTLRLILGKKESNWIEGKQKTPLVLLPVGDNHVLIYTDLGVYTGERLGTPCDDL